VGSLCSSLTSKVKSVFGIHSPSKVFAEIGGYLDEGLENGIDGNRASLLGTASSLANAVTDGLTPGSPEIELSTDDTVNSISALADKLGTIADTFKTITTMLTSMDSFVIPQIAAGTIVPYKTKIDDSSAIDSASGAESTGIRGFAEDVDNRMANEAYLLQQILDAVKKLNLNIDIDSLSRAITKAQRDRSLNFGGV
jgi:glycyl-tRNA synthetase beta subunit